MTFIDQTVLVTGATGFLGGALAQRLVVEGVRVRALVRSPQKAGVLRQHGVEIAEGDLTDAEAVRRAADGCRIIFHVGAALSGSYTDQQRVNVEGTRHVVQAAVNVERLVHVSSVSIYGYNYAGDVTEEFPAAPGADPYPITKAQAEQVVQASSVPYVIIRPGMIYGPGAPNWTEAMFKLGRLKPTPFLGDGHGSAFPIHVDDVVDLLVVAAAHPAAVKQSFNCAPDPAPTWREYLGSYSRLAGHDRWLAIPPVLFYPVGGLALLFAPRYSMLRDLPDLINFSQRRFAFKMDKARDLLGWQPKVDLASGIAGCAPALRQQGLLS